MTLVRVDNIGVTGIITDIPGYELPPEAWTAGQNIRFRDNKVQKFLGHSTVFGTPSIAPLWLLPVYAPTAAFWLYPGTAKVYATDMATHANITRQTASVDVDYAATGDVKWNGGVLNGIAILNNGVDAPQMWSPPALGTKLVQLTNWPASTTAQVIRTAFQYFLLALDVTESSTRYPQVLRWSHPAAPGAVPSSWDYTDVTKDAGRTPVADTPGFLLDFAMLGQQGILYKEDSTYSVQYVGGRSIFSIAPLFSDLGLLARECAKAFRGMHFMVTPDDIVIHNGREPKSILTGRQKAALFSRIDATFKPRCFVLPNYGRSEMWFCYPESGQTQPNRALVWNWDSGTLGDRQLGGQIAFGTFGVVNPTALSQVWDSDAAAWDTDSTAWDARLYDPTISSILLARNDTPLLLYPDQTNQFSGTSFISYVERDGLSIVGRDRAGNPKDEPNVIKYVKRILPRIIGGPVDVYVGSQMVQDGLVTWTGPFTFDPATTIEILCNVVGRFICVKFQSTGNVAWELTGYELDMDIVGRY